MMATNSTRDVLLVYLSPPCQDSRKVISATCGNGVQKQEKKQKTKSSAANRLWRKLKDEGLAIGQSNNASQGDACSSKVAKNSSIAKTEDSFYHISIDP
jgi:hypothetical protein